MKVFNFKTNKTIEVPDNNLVKVIEDIHEEAIERRKYKGKFKNEQGVDRQLRIKNCSRVGCNGAPETKPFKIDNITGNCCIQCLEVTDYIIKN